MTDQLKHTSRSPLLHATFYGSTRQQVQRNHFQKLVAHYCGDYIHQGGHRADRGRDVAGRAKG